ncbi:hypothetical protein ED733_005682 [Metarhizium rileyi]|uniref:Myb transcription factor n=1 Tax=Metarhizium rileyi (strain RCEF 4871) TaxID=1649241 RepID=A0A5C6GEK1_METRR|nr:hypothetical protein ED733_005682 [Metarhizium rileyi]
MADVDDYSITGSEDAADIEGIPGVDDDFGAIEMFDSNAEPSTFSSQAPVAVMSEEITPKPSTKKSKRDRKAKEDKKRAASKEGIVHSSPIHGEEGSSWSQHKAKRKTIRDVEFPDSPPTQTRLTEHSSNTPWGRLQDVEEEEVTAAGEAAASTTFKTKTKRKLSDSADGKGRRKRRSHDQKHGGQTIDSGSSPSLYKRKSKRSVQGNVIYEHDEADADPQQSPTIAHVRRRSQSRDARSRENSAPVESQMDVDLGIDERTKTDATPLAEADDAIERLAREAWNEHRIGQQALDEGENRAQEKELADEYPQNPLDDSVDGMVEAQPPNAKSKKNKSTRKKAKPTYYEQDPIPDIASDDEGHRNAMGELPSPSAATPKAGRVKRAAKKESRGRKPKREKLSQSMRGGSADGVGALGQASGQSRNRLVGYTQGRFTDAELARIARAVECYRADHDISQQEVNELIHAPGGTTAGETHAQLWSRIFAECPDRHRQKVINITRKKFHNFVARGTWTAEQDTELAELIQQHGTKWSHIAGLINRHPEDLRDRYRNYIVCGPNQRKDAWDENEEARLTQHIIESMMVIDELRANQPSRPLLQKSYEELIDWQNISELMDRTRSRLQCITKWKSLNIRTHGRDHLISSQPDSQISFRLEKARRQIAAMPVEERYRLVMAINATTVSTDAKIPWQKLVDKPFRNQWHRSTQMLLWRRLKQSVPNWENSNVRDCAQYLVDQYNQTGDLPEVADKFFDDAEEMHYIQAITPVSISGIQGDGRGQVSAEFIRESDGEYNNANEDIAQLEEGEEHQPEEQDVEMRIDPALAEVATSPKKSTPAKSTTFKTPRSRKRRRRSAADDDSIEDTSEGPQEPQRTQEYDAEVDDEQLRAKTTPSKLKSPRGKKATQQTSPSGSGKDSLMADSVMDDMEDLPARIAVA